jgi:hypothetical protein
MNPRRFLDLAERLVQGVESGRALTGRGGEVECRCAIGRAYYAAFLVAREFLESLDIAVPNGGACHTAAQRGLNNSGVSTLAVIAGQLGKLYTGRADADYDMRMGAVETAKDARAAVDLARTLVTMIDVILAGGLSHHSIARELQERFSTTRNRTHSRSFGSHNKGFAGKCIADCHSGKLFSDFPLHSIRPGIDDRDSLDLARVPIAAVDVAADDETRPHTENRVADGGAADVAAATRDINAAPRRRVHDQHAPSRTWRQQFPGLVLVEVVAPGAERRHRDAAADAEEGDAVNRGRGAVEDMGGGPIATVRREFVGRLVVTGDEHGRPVCATEDVEAVREVLADVGEIAGADEDIDNGRAANDRSRRGRVAVKIAEEKEFHERRSF